MPVDYNIREQVRLQRLNSFTLQATHGLMLELSNTLLSSMKARNKLLNNTERLGIQKEGKQSITTLP